MTTSADQSNAWQYPPSPVPSDETLLPGELPFTAFGQFGEGKMDNRVFDQDVYWVNIKGEGFRLDEMPSDYRRNVINFLLQNCEYFHAWAALRSGIDALTSALRGEVHAEILTRELGLPTLDELDPYEWLESTPLMRRLRKLEAV